MTVIQKGQLTFIFHDVFHDGAEGAKCHYPWQVLAN